MEQSGELPYERSIPVPFNVPLLTYLHVSAKAVPLTMSPMKTRQHHAELIETTLTFFCKWLWTVEDKQIVLIMTSPGCKLPINSLFCSIQMTGNCTTDESVVLVAIVVTIYRRLWELNKEEFLVFVG